MKGHIRLGLRASRMIFLECMTGAARRQSSAAVSRHLVQRVATALVIEAAWRAEGIEIGDPLKKGRRHVRRIIF
jgi:hypothetical protein